VGKLASHQWIQTSAEKFVMYFYLCYMSVLGNLWCGTGFSVCSSKRGSFHNKTVVKNCSGSEWTRNTSRCVQEMCAFNNGFFTKLLDSWTDNRAGICYDYYYYYYIMIMCVHSEDLWHKFHQQYLIKCMKIINLSINVYIR
jgi:hypothetical protein